MIYPKSYKAISSVLQLYGITNGSFDFQQEEAVRDIFLSSGFVERCNLNIKIRTYQDWIVYGCLVDILPEGTFIRNPFGKSAHPDFLLREGGKLFWYECKSSHTNSNFHCNTTLPIAGIVYILTLPKKTIVAFGERIITDAERQLFSEWEEKIKMVKVPHVDGIVGRPRLFFEISATNRFVNGGYGDKCSQEVLDILKGIVPSPPIKVGAYQEDYSAWLEQFLV